MDIIGNFSKSRKTNKLATLLRLTVAIGLEKLFKFYATDPILSSLFLAQETIQVEVALVRGYIHLYSYSL